MNTKTHLKENLTFLSMRYLMLAVLVLISPIIAADEAQPTVKTLRVNNYDMSYIESGSGETLILVHGALNDYRTWLPLMEDFSVDNHTIAVSLRHYYPEQWNGKGNDLSLQQHADDLSAFIKALNTGPVHLLGHSRGGAVALLMASQHPEQIRRLILADPAPLTTMLTKSPAVQAIANQRKAKLQKVMTYYQQGDTEGGLKEFVDYIAGSGAWEKSTPEMRNTLRSNKWTQISLLDDIETPFNCNNAGKLPVPVLIVTGQYSAPIYGHMNASLQNCLKQASDITIADAGHMMFRANPTAFIFQVQDFIMPE